MNNFASSPSEYTYTQRHFAEGQAYTSWAGLDLGNFADTEYADGLVNQPFLHTGDFALGQRTGILGGSFPTLPVTMYSFEAESAVHPDSRV